MSFRIATFFAGCLAVLTLRAAVEVPPGFAAESLVTGLNAATAMVPMSDGRILIADQTGPLRVWQDGKLQDEPILDLSARLDTYWERGLIGVALHPEYPRQPYLYCVYVARSPFTHHVLSRFVWNGGGVDPTSEQVLLTGDDQGRYPGSHPHGHQGGPLRFGPDGKLYVGIGEQTAGRPAQELDNILGKILRLNDDGSIPADNPFVDVAQGKYRAIYARGLRNPFGLAFQPETGRLFMTDVGQTSWEEVNEITRGPNYGWPEAEGASTRSDFVGPLYAYPPAIGRSIVGAAFAPVDPPSVTGSLAFPAPWREKFFFADWAANWIKALDPDEPSRAVNFARGLNGPVAIEFAADGSLLVLERGTIWIDRKTFVARSGSLTRIRYTGQVDASANLEPPATLAATGVFADLRGRTIAQGFAEFELNAPLWLPGVRARRWLALPGSGAATISDDGSVRLPEGARVVQHFETLGGQPFETHVFWFTDVLPRAAAYRWRGDGNGADLVRESTLGPIPGTDGTQWHSPGPETQLNLATSVSGFVLQLTVAQLNRDVPTPKLPVFGGRPAAAAKLNQLALWNRRGWLAAPLSAKELESLPRLVSLDDATASLERRVRSYMESNCAMCHQPGGPSRALFDARASVPLEQSGLIDTLPIAGDLGIDGARLVVPGAPERSLLLLRLQDPGPLRMPPVRLSEEPSPVIPLLEQWIRSLAH